MRSWGPGMSGRRSRAPGRGWDRPETSAGLGGNISRRWVGFGLLGVEGVDGELG